MRCLLCPLTGHQFCARTCGHREKSDWAPNLRKPSLAKQTDPEADNRSPVYYCLVSPRQTLHYAGENNNEITGNLPVSLTASLLPSPRVWLVVGEGRQLHQPDGLHPKGPSFPHSARHKLGRAGAGPEGLR